MSETIIATIRFRRGTAALWTERNPTPASGEPCLETDTGLVKVGNGIEDWNTLDYLAGAAITGLVERLDEADVQIADIDGQLATVDDRISTAISESLVGVDARLDETDGSVEEINETLTGRLSEEALADEIATGVAGKADATNVYSKTQAKAAFSPTTRPLNVVLFGTSIQRQESAYADPVNNQFKNGTSDGGMFSHANSIAGQPFRVIYNAGVSGNNSAQMLARLQSDVTDKLPDGGWVFVGAGTPNDIGTGITLAQSILNHKAIYDALKAAGLGVIIVTPTPYGLNDFRSYVAGTHRWMLGYAREQGHPVADILPVLSATDGSRYWRDFYSDGTNGTKTDGIHPKSPGALAAGKVIAAVLRRISGEVVSPFLPASNADTWNLLTNGMMTGAAGTTKPSGVTGNLATSWSAYGFTGTGGVGALSKVARTDLLGVGGEWQQYVAQAGNVDGFILQQQNIAGLGTSWNPGDVMLAVSEYQTDADWAGGIQLNLTLNWHGAGGGVGDLQHSSSDPGWGQPAASGIQLVRGLVPAATTRLTVSMQCKMTTGTARFGRAGLYNMTQMAAAGIVPAALAVAPG